MTTNEPIRYSHLRQMAKSAAHYQAVRNATEWPDSPAMRLGRLVHGLVLGGTAAPVVYPGERRGKAWQDFQAAHDGAEIVTQAEADRAQPIADAVRADGVAGPLLGHPAAVLETRMTWDMSGRLCAGTPDLYVPGQYLLDLKTTSNAEPAAFQRHAWGFHYHAQMSWYQTALMKLGIEVPEVYLVAVETSAPYGVSVHRLDHQLLEEGRRLWCSWWERLCVCDAAGVWPGYAEAPLDWGKPAWMVGTDDEVADV